ncbi:MAG: hypothetical protein SH868_00775 [Bythopirellula sp.]|nr:hypothetical protein [Bythopirellula sp.]
MFLFLFFNERDNVMKSLNLLTASMLFATVFVIARAEAQQEDAHGVGPNGGVVFDLGAHHVEFTVDHEKQEAKIVVLGADEKSPGFVAASEFIVVTKETRTADGKVVPALTLVLLPQDDSNGKASTFVGTDPGIANVADFAGSISGDIDGKPASGEFDEAAGGHAHATPHDGVVAVLKGQSGEEVGFLELKLHDDKGDLELWIGKDRQMKEPIDLPADTKIDVSFKDLPGKSATLTVRNNEKNEDEDGNANLRNGLTNYFIFPGSSGQDASWLVGKEFKSKVEVTLTADGERYRSEEFVLIPHTHADGHAHSHE